MSRQTEPSRRIAQSRRFVLRNAALFTVLQCTSLLCTAATASSQENLADGIAITNVTVIDGSGAPPIKDATVLVEAGRIAAVGPADTLSIPSAMQRIDGEGRVLVPGFVDTHAHLSVGPVVLEMADGKPTVSMKVLADGPERTLLALLAHGITTIRDPGGSTEQLVAVRDAIERGDLLGPRAVVAGRVIDQSDLEGLVDQATTPDEVRLAVRLQVEAGVDLIKLYATLTPELLAAGIDEAHLHGRQAIAHLHETTWSEAATLGLDGIVHIIPGSSEMLPADVRETYAAKPGTLGFPHWFSWVDLDSETVKQTIRKLALERVYLDPTLVVFEHAFFGDSTRFTTATEGLELAHPALVDNWKRLFSFNIGWNEADFDVARRSWPKVLRLTRQLWEAGVLLSAGTDANNPWTVPGPSFHRELQLLVQAGIPSAQVLRIGTRNGAEVAGLLDDVGTIEKGKRADLILLDGDPVADIRATSSIVWVMKEGIRYRPSELLERLR